MAGQDAVRLTIGVPLTFKPVTVFSEGTGNVPAALASHGVRRLVCVTGIGAGESKGHGIPCPIGSRKRLSRLPLSALRNPASILPPLFLEKLIPAGIPAIKLILCRMRAVVVLVVVFRGVKFD